MELGESAGLEAGRDQDGVGAGLHQVGQRLVPADDHAHPARVVFRRRLERALQIRIAGAEQGEARAARDQSGQDLQQQVQTLLPRETADHAEQRAGGAGIEAEPPGQARAVPGLAGRRPRGEVRGDVRVALRIPDLQVDAVEDAAHLGAPRSDDPFESHAELRARQLARVGRADRRDAVRVDEAGLEEADLAEELEASGVEPAPGQPQRFRRLRREQALKGHVVDRQQAGRRRPAAELEVRGGQARLPVVEVHDVRLPAIDPADGDSRRGAAQGTVAQVVVGPVAAVGAEVGIAGPVEQPGRIQDHEIDACGPRADDTRPPAGQPPERAGFGVFGKCRLHGRIARHQDAHLDAQPRQGARQGAGHVGEAARLDEGHALGGDGQCLHRNYSPLLATHPSTVMFRPMDSRLRGNDEESRRAYCLSFPRRRESIGLVTTDTRSG